MTRCPRRARSGFSSRRAKTTADDIQAVGVSHALSLLSWEALEGVVVSSSRGVQTGIGQVDSFTRTALSVACMQFLKIITKKSNA